MRTSFNVHLKGLFLFALGTMFSFGCAPKFYLLDRQTVMEEEAAGEWPDFEETLLKTSNENGPTPFVKAESTLKKDKLYRVLNGEVTTEPNSKPLRQK